MNKYLFVLMTSCLFSFSNHQITLQKIKVEYVDRDIETPYSVSCSNFESFFGKKDFKEKTIYSKEELKKITMCLDQVSKSSASTKEIDVRAKLIVFYSNGSTKVVCVDQFDNAVIDQKYIVGKSGFLSFVSRNCKGF